MMGNSLPVEDRGAQAAPEQNPGAQSLTEQGHGAQSLTEQGHGAQSLAEQDHGAQSLAEQDHGAQSLVEQDQSAQRASEPENGEMREAEPEDGATSGQEVSSPEAAGGYAAHVASPGTPASVPSLGSGRYRPPEDSPVAEVSAQPVVIADDDGDAWGPWRAPPSVAAEPPSVAADGPAEQAGGVVASSEARDVKRPRRGLPSGSQVRLGAVPAPGEAEEHLLRQVFMREQERRIQEGLSLGMRLQAEADEPLPMLSHFYGRPSSTESMYDSLSLALTDHGFLTRVALGGGSSQDVVGGATGITGKGRLDRPEEFAEETPYMPPRPPRFPEQEQQRPQQKLLIDQATITDNALEEWHSWLKLAQQGRSLREWGILGSDIVTAVQYLGEAPPMEEPAARGGRWSNAPRGGRRKQQQEYPTSVGVLLYLKKALKCIDCFDRAPSGYHGLLLGPSSAMALERPDGGTASDEREAWKYIAASIAARVQRLLDKKRAKNRAVTEMTAIYHAGRGQLGFLFGGIRSFGRKPAGRRGRGGSYWGYSFLPRQGGVPLDPWCGLSSLWDARVSAPGFSRSCRRGCGRKECRSSPRSHRYRSFGSSRIFGHGGWNSSGYSGNGAANSGGNRAEKPGKLGISYLPARAVTYTHNPAVTYTQKFLVTYTHAHA